VGIATLHFSAPNGDKYATGLADHYVNEKLEAGFASASSARHAELERRQTTPPPPSCPTNQYWNTTTRRCQGTELQNWNHFKVLCLQKCRNLNPMIDRRFQST
jgi:hypothetical protein